jgi:hypothetical protein
MSAGKDEKPQKEYTYEVPKSVEERVKRVFKEGAPDVLKKLKAGKIVGKGPHTFKAKKIRVLPEVKELPATEEKEGAPEGAPSSSEPSKDTGDNSPAGSEKGPGKDKGGK